MFQKPRVIPPAALGLRRGIGLFAKIRRGPSEDAGLGCASLRGASCWAFDMSDLAVAQTNVPKWRLAKWNPRLQPRSPSA